MMIGPIRQKTAAHRLARDGIAVAGIKTEHASAHHNWSRHRQAAASAMSTRTTSGTAIGLGIAFLCILSLLHVWEPDYNPPHLISDYQLGHFGWLMSLAFFCLGGALIALFAAARQHSPTQSGRFWTWGLLVISAAYFVAGIFPPDRQKFLVGLLHGIGGLVVIFGSPIVFTFVSRGFAANEASKTVPRPLVWTAALTWLSLSLFYGSIVASRASGSGNIAVGWTNRFMIATFVLWLLVAAVHVWSRSR